MPSILFIGFLIAQPIKIFFIRHQLDLQIEKYKEGLINEFRKRNEIIYKRDLKKLYSERENYSSLAINESITMQIIKIDNSIIKIEEEIENDQLNAVIKINNSNFFSKRIELASQYKISKLVVALVVIIFCLPIVLINSISRESNYYKQKKKSDRKKVLDHYNLFKLAYQKIFENKYQIEGVSFYEHFQDPPFNTVRKTTPNYAHQDDFFLKYLK